MPNHNLTTRPAIAKIKHAPGTIMYSDPSVKPDPDARGIRLAVGATKKTWVLSKRIDGKVRSVTLGACARFRSAVSSYVEMSVSTRFDFCLLFLRFLRRRCVDLEYEFDFKASRLKPESQGIPFASDL